MMNLYCFVLVAGKVTLFVPHQDIKSLRITLTTETYGAESPDESVATPFVVPAGGVNHTVPVSLFVMYAQPVNAPTQLIDPLVDVNPP